MHRGVQTLRRWFKSTSRRTFVVLPVALIVLEYFLRGGEIRINLWGLPLLVWGYLQYRLAGDYRIRLGGGGPGMANPPERLVSTGIYAATRNPMYLGHLIFISGLAITLRSLTAVALLLVHMAWFHKRVLVDERRLEEAWGPEYIDYTHRVKRWLPGLF